MSNTFKRIGRISVLFVICLIGGGSMVGCAHDHDDHDHRDDMHHDNRDHPDMR